MERCSVGLVGRGKKEGKGGVEAGGRSAKGWEKERKAWVWGFGASRSARGRGMVGSGSGRVKGVKEREPGGQG